MTLSSLILYVGIAALVLTLLVEFVFKKRKSWVTSYLQNFTGALFIFSGWVKAIDPLGTAYKMEQYFDEFAYHFTWFKGIFPVLAEYALAFSVIFIILELVLGVMLIIGARPKLTAWLFLFIVGFFTVLTGFTHLTGYVPRDASFFEFAKWGEFLESNRKVTDCGCFGDFLKLDPYVSFLKDVFLFIPAIFFIFANKNFHQLFTKKVRTGITLAGIALFGFYGFSNFAWDLPDTDFRPFAIGTDIPARKQLEEDAQANIPISYELTNKQSGEMVSMSMDEYLKKYKDFPKSEWDSEQIKGEPSVPFTKISEFEISNVDGEDMTASILADPNYSFMIVCYKFYANVIPNTVTRADTSYVVDTIRTGDSIRLERKIASIDKKQIRKDKYLWDKDYKDAFKNVINPLAEAAEKVGVETFAVVGGAGPDQIENFRHDNQTAYPFHTADDILLKTIVRSNPGIVLLKKGVVVHKWHYKQLPSFEEIKANYMK